MSKSVNVDFVTRQIEVDTDGKEHFISTAMAAKDAEQSMLNAQNAANTAEKIANDLGLVDEAVQTAVASAEQASNSSSTASNKADVATAKADVAITKASEASASAATATAKADAASTSATNASQSYANADAIATQLTEYLATKESLTAPAVDKTLLIEGAAADSKVVGMLKDDLANKINSLSQYTTLSDNEFNNQWVDGGYIDPNTGEQKPASSFKYTDFIKLRDGKKRILYSVCSIKPRNYNIILFDINKNFIKSAQNTDVEELDDNISYARMYVSNDFTGETYLSTRRPSSPVNYAYYQGGIINTENLSRNIYDLVPTSDNLFDGHFIDDKYIDKNDNTIKNANGYKCVADYIKLPKGHNRTLYASCIGSTGNSYILIYNSNYEIIVDIGIGMKLESLPISDNAEFVRFYCSSGISNVYISTAHPSKDINYLYSADYRINPSIIELPSNNSLIKDKIVVMFGDSIYGNFRANVGTEKSISSYVSEFSKYTVYNCGYGGTQMSKHNSSDFDAFSMCNLVDALITGNWSSQQTAASGNVVPDYYESQLLITQNINLNSADVVIIEHCTNDFGNSSALYSTPDAPYSKDTYEGALRYTLKALMTNFPALKIVVQNPTPRFNDAGVSSDVFVNKLGFTLVDYMDVQNKVCKEFKVPTINAYYSLNFNEYTRNSYYANDGIDGTHLGKQGRRVLGELIAKNLLYNV